MTRTVEHKVSERRFEMIEEGVVSLIDYRLDGEVMSILHTEVPPAVGGRGIAGELTRVALETARKAGWQVRPVCSYAAAYIRKHPEYQDLLA